MPPRRLKASKNFTNLKGKTYKVAKSSKSAIKAVAKKSKKAIEDKVRKGLAKNSGVDAVAWDYKVKKEVIHTYDSANFLELTQKRPRSNQNNFLELTQKRQGSGHFSSNPENNFNDLTKGDQWGFYKGQVWDNVKKSQNQSSWNPHMVKDNSQILKSEVKPTQIEKGNKPSPESVLRDNKMNKYGNYKPIPKYNESKGKVEVGKKLDINA